MVQYIITPWRNQGELLLVREQLYPDLGEPTKESYRSQAVAQVSVWMQRGNCPHLVESTAILTSAILNDNLGNSTYCVRAAYSAAFCRFVTGLLDSHQDKRRKLSMYSIAKTIGLPATYVELRHQATHEELPSLAKLRSATQKALRWIWDYYWIQLYARTPGADECKKFVQRLVEEKSEDARAILEPELKNWDTTDVLEAFEHLDSFLSNPKLLLRSIQLQETFLGNDFSASQSQGGASPKQTIKTLEDAATELSRMERALAEVESLSDSVSKSSTAANDISASGWTRREGPWVPRPIGMV